ncbi:MAG: hypothetical protein OHK0023_06090 [Anaerolineae bacterium]
MTATYDTNLNAPNSLISGPISWRQTVRNALIVTRREVIDSLRDWRIMAPIFILTFGFPFLAQGMTEVLTSFFEQNGATDLINNFLPLLPMIVGFFPIAISLVIALETFVGEKERRSLEPLLSTPLTNLELYLGKTLAAMLPPLFAAYIGIAFYLGGLILGERQWRPTPELIILIVLLTTAQALVMVTGAVVVSSQTTSTRASNLLASFIIIPTSLLVIFEALLMVNNRRQALWWLLLALLVIDVILFRMGAMLFNREELLGRQIDTLNLRWAWRQFRQQIRGDKAIKSVAGWYRHTVFPALKRSRTAILVVALFFLIMFLGGSILSSASPLGIAVPDTPDEFRQTFVKAMSQNTRLTTIPFYIFQNVRVLLLTSGLAVISLGVAGIILPSVTFAAIGFLLTQPIVGQIGYDVIALALIPHSIFELPAILIAAGAATRLGTIITKPPKNASLLEVMVKAAGDLVVLWIGLVLPLLTVAAVIEAYLTPRLVLSAIGG